MGTWLIMAPSGIILEKRIDWRRWINKYFLLTQISNLPPKFQVSRSEQTKKCIFMWEQKFPKSNIVKKEGGGWENQQHSFFDQWRQFYNISAWHLVMCFDGSSWWFAWNLTMPLALKNFVNKNTAAAAWRPLWNRLKHGWSEKVLLVE